VTTDWRTRLWQRVRSIRIEARNVVIIVLLLLNFLFTAAYQNHSQVAFRHQQAEQQAAARRQQATEQAVQRKAGLLIEEKICEDVGSMERIPPPRGAAAANPSRAYEQAEHRTWRGLFLGLDCNQLP
jgi:DNA-binding protein H-NS